MKNDTPQIKYGVREQSQKKKQEAQSDMILKHAPIFGVSS
jgi:hypothetical protein